MTGMLEPFVFVAGAFALTALIMGIGRGISWLADEAVERRIRRRRG